MTNTRQMFFPVVDIIDEFRYVLGKKTFFDVVTIVGEGEPTLYLGLKELIEGLKELTDKPVAVITNGALLYDNAVQSALLKADIVLPTFDAYDKTLFRKINRPHRSLDYNCVKQGLIDFSHRYQGQLWLEIMLVKGMNEDGASLEKYRSILEEVKYDKIYLNTPVRPPAESGIKAVDHAVMLEAEEVLGGISIDLLESVGFHSEIKDDLEAILSIIKRHPMNQFEIESFLKSRENADPVETLERLAADGRVNAIDYKGFITFRLK